jgi:histone H3/H4
MTTIPVASVDRLIRKAGAPRVSEGAAVALAEILEKIAIELGQQAALFATHAGRKTVTAEDIKLAEEQRLKK